MTQLASIAGTTAADELLRDLVVGPLTIRETP
jgi:hypothetical protein